MPSIAHLCWCNWRKLWRKNAAGSSQRGSCYCTTMPWLTGHLQPRRTGLSGLPLSWNPPYSPDLAPSDYHLLPGLKPIERSPFFLRHRGHSCRGDLIGWTNFWFFLSGLQKLEQRAKKCIELRGGICWTNVACFLPGRAKDLSAPLVEFWEYSKYKNPLVFVILSVAGNLEEKALARN